MRFPSLLLRLVMPAAVAGLLVPGLSAQEATARPWQKLQMPSLAEVRAKWLSPPSEYGPEPYYGLNGPVTIETVQRDLDTMRALGFRAVTVQYGYGSERAYLSPEYMSFFRQFVAEAKKRDLRVWIVDDAGYPSGFAGGKFSAEHPELRMQALVVTAHQTLSAGQLFDQAAGPNVVAVTALPQSGDGEAKQIPVVEGHARWTAPAGAWMVFVVEHAFRTSPTRSDTNPKRVKDGSQSLEDYMDPKATAQYLAFTHDAYKRAVGEEFGKTILGFRGDEPDYSISGLPWTPAFFARFERDKGYDIRPFLAAFLQSREPVLTPRQMLAKADYYDVFARMFAEGFFKPQADWCAANGLEYQVHLNHEEQQLQLARSEGDFFRDMRFVQVPGIDTIWHQIWTDTVSDFPRFASSAAHVYGHPRAFTESFAAYRPLPNLQQARYILNEQFARGVNLVEAMYFPASSTPEHGGPMEFMRDPGYPALMTYASRISFLMSQGRPGAQIALLLPSESLWMGDKSADDTFVSTERLLSEHQVDFDIVDEDAIGSILTLASGEFITQSGNGYRTVFVPHASLLPQAVVARLKTFAKGGGHVVFLGAAPRLVGTANDLNAREATADDFTWATVVPGDLPVVPTPPAQPPTSAPEPMTVPPAMLGAILKPTIGYGPVALASPDTALRLTTRVLGDGTHLVFLFNESDHPLDTGLLINMPSDPVEQWDALAGTTTRVQFKESKTSAASPMPLHLPAYGATVLVLRPLV